MNKEANPFEKISQAFKNDEIIMQLCVYEATNGMTKSVNSQEVILNLFKEFKGHIKAGEYTLQELSDMVALRHGITETCNFTSPITPAQVGF